jgi:hypothetical protein
LGENALLSAAHSEPNGKYRAYMTSWYASHEPSKDSGIMLRQDVVSETTTKKREIHNCLRELTMFEHPANLCREDWADELIDKIVL